MKQIELIKTQTEDAYKWANKLIESIPSQKWDEIPDNLDTNVTWQIGHLIMSFNFNSIMVIKGHQTDHYQKFPIQKYAKLFVKAEPIESVGQTKAESLFEHCKLVQYKSIEIISNLTDDELNENLEPTEVPHPIAKSKFEALDWNIKHTMWHCGQIGILKRILDKRYDFGLKV